MPKMILAAAAQFFRSAPPRAGTAHAEMTRSRDRTRRLRESRAHRPYVYLGPLDLARRH